MRAFLLALPLACAACAALAASAPVPPPKLDAARKALAAAVKAHEVVSSKPCMRYGSQNILQQATLARFPARWNNLAEKD